MDRPPKASSEREHVMQRWKRCSPRAFAAQLEVSPVCRGFQDGCIDQCCPWGIVVWSLLPVAAKCVVDQRRAWTTQMMCRIRNTGTANVGI